MAYSTGMMRFRVQVARRTTATSSDYGKDAAGVPFESLGTFWAAVDFVRGAKAMMEGAYDAFDSIMVRMRWNEDITRECLLQYDGRWYQIDSCHRDYELNIIQITAREYTNQSIILMMQLADSNGAALETSDEQILCASARVNP